jgi:hypothetical protein
MELQNLIKKRERKLKEALNESRKRIADGRRNN